MSNYFDEGRYNNGVQFPTTKPGLTPAQVAQVSGDLTQAPTREVPYEPLTVSQNDYRLAEGDFHKFTQGLGVSITGFVGARAGLQTIVNVDASTNLTLAHNSASSTDTSRIICHTGANIVLSPNQSVLIRYDFGARRWRTIGFT